MANESTIAASFWDDVETEVRGRLSFLGDAIREAVLSDGGRPPLTERRTERDEYETLIAMRRAGDPGYWTNPAAAQRLQELVPKFGPPPEGSLPAPFQPEGGMV